MKNSYDITIKACYFGYITQAIINNFAPLLFVTFQREFQITLEQTAMLISVNFGVQLMTDFLSAKYAERMGYRISMVLAHLLSALGLMGLGIFPTIFPSPLAGMLTAIVIYAVGGGLIEVLVSPIVEACPTEHKEATMSLLHSFYCWGHVGVILISTAFFVFAGIENWKLLSCLWAMIPAAGMLLFLKVPIPKILEDGEGMSVRELCKNGTFWLLILLMICSGASEQGMSQWASAFAEKGLHVSKTMGDILGPCFFAVMMGSARLFYGKQGAKINLYRFMTASAVLCICSYLLATFSPIPLLSLLGCGLCGLSVGIMWPGSFSIAAAKCPTGGTAMFALLALAGDLGCGLGPTVVGNVAERLQGDLKKGLLAAMIFPILMIFGVKRIKKNKENQP